MNDLFIKTFSGLYVVSIYVYIFIYVFVYMYVIHVYMSIYIYIYMCVCVDLVPKFLPRCSFFVLLLLVKW